MTTGHDSSPPTTDMTGSEDGAQQSQELVGCRVCGRNFNPNSVDKHERICERTAAKKRKPFDSAKQRIKGTELAEFLPKQTHQPELTAPPSRRPSQDDRPLPRRTQAWKEKRNDFLKAIRAARGADTTRTAAAQHQTSSSSSGPSGPRPSTLSLVTSSGAPLRANEKGQCPTCHRQFGVKSYERHVAFCRERATRLPCSPLTNSNPARERLEARMSYRAPQLRNRRPTNREKYSPGAAHKLAVQPPPPPQPPVTARSPAAPREPRNEPPSPKLPLLKRMVQPIKESPVTSNGPLKARPIDRSNRSSDSLVSLNPPAVRQLFASRHLLLLSDILPSRNLQSKSSVSSNSSQASSPKLTAAIFKNELNTSSTESSLVVDSRTRKRTRPKRSHRKIEIQLEERRETLEPAAREFADWNQICAREIDSIDKEEEPAMSDVTGLSSSRANSALDDFEYNEKCCEFGPAAPTHEPAVPSLEQTYTMAAPLKLDSSIDSEAFANLLSRSNKNRDPEDEAKRLEKNEDLVGQKSKRHAVEEETASIDNPQTMKSYIIKKDGIETVFDEPTAETSDRPLVQPKKCLSMPNIVDLRIDRVAGIAETMRRPARNVNQTSGFFEDATPGSRDTSSKPEVTIEPGSPKKQQQQQQQRCVTYVIDEPRVSQQQFVPVESSSSGNNRVESERLANNSFAVAWKTGASDYYEVASLSDGLSARTEVFELEEDLAEENESNASGLLKEIDSCLGGSLRRPFTDDSLTELSARLKAIDLTRPRSSRGPRYDRYADLEEDSSVSRLELTPRADKHVTRHDDCFLPAIRPTKHRRTNQARPDPTDDPARNRLPCVRWTSQLSYLRRSFERLPRCDWDSHAARRHPDFSMILRRRTGDKKYDPFLLAEQQFNDLFSDTSEQSSVFPSSQVSPILSKSPLGPPQQQQQQQAAEAKQQQQRASVIAPPMGFDDLTSSSELSSDCAETNSLSREPLSSSSNSTAATTRRTGGELQHHVLGRRLIIDQSQALGGGEFAPRASRSSSSSSSQGPDDGPGPTGRSLFDQLVLGSGPASPYDEHRLPHLMSILDAATSSSSASSSSSSSSPPLSSCSPGAQHHRGRPNCSDDDAEMSSPESVKRQGGKLSADSAYSSLNRKYSTYGRSANDVNGRCKPSRFCHECGSRFPDGAKFCCECGVKRLTV